jgi:hypothetical protein
MGFNKKVSGQGTLEYLVIIAIVIVIALVVVGLLIGFFSPVSGVGDNFSQLKNWSNSLALTETSVTPDGNYLVRLVNNSSDPITISNVNIGGEDANYSEDLFMGSGQNFVVSSSDICSEGGKLANSIVITYVTKLGLVKTEKYPASTFFECQNYNVNLLADQCPSTSPDSICVPSADSDLNAKNISSNASIFGVTGYLGLHSGQTKCTAWNGSTWINATTCSDVNVPANQNAAVDNDRNMFVNGRFIAYTNPYGDGNNFVEDTWNNLLWWKGQSSSTMDWNSAMSYCNNFSAGGFSDWRLATVAEAFSTFDFSGPSASSYVCVQEFSPCFTSYVWTSTSLPWSPTDAYY